MLAAKTGKRRRGIDVVTEHSAGVQPRSAAGNAAESGCERGAMACADSVPPPSAVKTTATQHKEDDEDDQKCAAIHGSLLAMQAGIGGTSTLNKAHAAG